MPNNKEQTQTDILKHYLLEKDNPYLLDENNNGKTIMLSGAWGSGKTHFWQEAIEPDLKTKLEDKACLYVSLYGKDNLDSLKKEILINASSVDNLLSKEVASFGFDVLSSIKDSDLKIGQLFKAFSEATDSGKSSKGLEQLKDGGIICFDDFERKSEKINLNDLFDFISQLAIELNCKIIIILNSDVFTGKEAEIFSNVKEKTISKFFYFNPSPEELFNSISDNSKYDALNEYKTNILSAIEETEELNARIYTQVLDNCLEWLEVKKGIDSNSIRVLVLSTFNFVLNHIILLRPKFFPTGYKEDYNIVYTQFNFPDTRLYKIFPSRQSTTFPLSREEVLGRKEDAFMRRYPNDTTLSLPDKIRRKLSETKNDSHIFSDSQQTSLLNWLNIESKRLDALWKYGYSLYYIDDINQNSYSEVSQFVETGILLP